MKLRGDALLLLVALLVLRTPRKFIAKAAIVELAAAVGFPDPNLAAAIALGESRGDVNAIGDFGQSYGLWQIHVPAHPQFSRAKLFDPLYNARAAFAISKGGTDWRPWNAYKEGTYLQFLK